VPDEPRTVPDDDAHLPDRGPLQGLQDMSEFLGGHPVNTGAFLRGLSIGARGGAAVAGPSIWRRLRRPGGGAGGSTGG
jgi:hypothetical protein